jgi:hypothetical protein
VVHLVGALLVAVVMSAPWPSLFSASLRLAACGFGGGAYGVTVIRRAARQKGY